MYTDSFTAAAFTPAHYFPPPAASHASTLFFTPAFLHYLGATVRDQQCSQNLAACCFVGLPAAGFWEGLGVAVAWVAGTAGQSWIGVVVVGVGFVAAATPTSHATLTATFVAIELHC